jgi:hypothetical protein
LSDFGAARRRSFVISEKQYHGAAGLARNCRFFYTQRASASTRRFDQPAAAPSDLINRIGDAGL